MPLLRLVSITKHYSVGGTLVKALDNVDLTIDSGEFSAVIGPSGSGKSTLMHLLGFLDHPTSGEIHFDGEEVARIGSNRRAMIRSEKIGFVFQSFNLLPRLTVLQNVLLPTSYARHRIPDVEKRARQACASIVNTRPSRNGEFNVAARDRADEVCFVLTKRVIPCLDVTGGRVVKGTNFVPGDAPEGAGAGEILFHSGNHCPILRPSYWG